MPLLITSSLIDVLLFCGRSCRLGLLREPSGPAGRHGNHLGLPPGSSCQAACLKAHQLWAQQKRNLSPEVEKGEEMQVWWMQLRQGAISRATFIGGCLSLSGIFAGWELLRPPHGERHKCLPGAIRYWDLISEH